MTRWPKMTLVAVLFLTLASRAAAATEPLASRATLRGSPKARLQEKAPTDPSPKKPFFKTRRGILIVSLSAIAVSYTVWSKQHDRVHSPVR